MPEWESCAWTTTELRKKIQTSHLTSVKRQFAWQCKKDTLHDTVGLVQYASLRTRLWLASKCYLEAFFVTLHSHDARGRRPHTSDCPQVPPIVDCNLLYPAYSQLHLVTERMQRGYRSRNPRLGRSRRTRRA
jgi:hypothetical protein